MSLRQIRIHLQGFAQDLAEPTFEIPEADAYYLYDPFCAETYRRVVDRLSAIARRRPITVVTKSGAGPWFLRLIRRDEWELPEEHDEKTLSLFRSQS